MDDEQPKDQVSDPVATTEAVEQPAEEQPPVEQTETSVPAAQGETETEEITEPVTETVEPATEQVIESNAEQTTEATTEVPTQAPTQAPTQDQTEVPTEAPTDAAETTETQPGESDDAQPAEIQTTESTAEAPETTIDQPAEGDGDTTQAPEVTTTEQVAENADRETTAPANTETVGGEDVLESVEPTDDNLIPAPASEPTPAPETLTAKTENGNEIIPNEIPSATVKFVLLPTGQVATMKCALNQTLKELKEHFAVELKIPSQVILLLHEGENMDNEKTLAELGVGPNGTVQLEMQSADPLNTPIKAFRPRQEYVMPDVITVRVETEPQRYKDIVVEVERATLKKPYLGGYRHKQNHKEFHHASAQTGAKPRPVSNVERFCRDTQTYYMRHRRQQTSEDTSTQMTKVGVYVSNMPDKLIIPGKYTTAEQHHHMILTKVIILQKYWRRWLATRYVDKIKDDRRQRVEWEEKTNAKKRLEKEARIRKEFERRMNPKSKEDFDLLYAALEKWRLEEMEKIDRTLTGAERKAALCQLLEQETQLIGSIGRHKQDADVENKQKSIAGFLDKAASPKKWKGPDGCYTEMDTPYTIRAQELRDIYNSICMKYLTQDERLDVLLTLKHTVKEHDCKLTRDIIELIDREADLLMRGVKDSNLEGLRKRISTLFLQYIKTPTFNPEVARLLKVPQDPSTLRQNIYYCSSCNQYLPSVEFQLSTNSRTVGRCRKCRNLDNDARTRHDYSHYRLMLRDLRRVEESYGDNSKVAFLLQENDLRYLVEKIWNSQSIISAWDDHYDLILVRWDKHKEWSPWNCVLITKEEATAHERLDSIDEGYGRELTHKVQRKHALAKNYFSRLPGMSEHMRTRTEQPPNAPSIEGISVN